MSINYSLGEVTVFQKDYAAAALLLPWSVTLSIISLPNVRCTVKIIFSSISAVNAPSIARAAYTQCAEWHYPANVRKRLPGDDNYHVMIVIRIWATHFHKESFNDATESQKYCLSGLQSDDRHSGQLRREKTQTRHQLSPIMVNDVLDIKEVSSEKVIRLFLLLVSLSRHGETNLDQ